MEPNISFIDTPTLEANGATLPITPDNSPIVVLPRFIATNIASVTSSDCSAARLYALRTEVNPFEAVPISVIPPIANFAEASKA